MITDQKLNDLICDKECKYAMETIEYYLLGAEETLHEVKDLMYLINKELNNKWQL